MVNPEKLVALATLASAYLWAFWGMYVLVMGLYRAHMNKRLTLFTFTLALPFLAIGYLMDVAANFLIATIIFLELPQEGLVTTRLARYLKSGSGWRYERALLICTNLLDPFDPSGKHCV
jgi:hypothetical protein